MGLFLPLFPLKLVVFPSEKLNLHIFEDRYKQLIKECVDQNTSFGLPLFDDNKLHNIGTEMKVESVAKVYPDGKMDIKTVGIGLFKIKRFERDVPGKLYVGADIERLRYTNEIDEVLGEKIVAKINVLHKYLALKAKRMVISANTSTYAYGHHIGLNLKEEYKLLSTLDGRNRQEFVLKHLKRILPIMKQMQLLRAKAKMNGHFKNMSSPELK